jgi:hypothetical protein
VSLDLSVPIRDAIVAETAITDELPAYLGSLPVFTRVPVPDDAPYPLIVVAAQFQGAMDDGINDQRPAIVRDVIVYGKNDTAANYRQVEAIAFAVRDLFHSQREAIIVPDWGVIDITAMAPAVAPVDDEQTVGRRVELTVRLARKN